MKKSYTDLEQCKKLAEILPLDSADMSYTLEFDSGKYYISTTSYKSWVVPKYAESYKGLNQVLPCWSLSALLDILLCPSLHKTFGGWRCDSYNKEGSSYILGKPSDNPVDACVQMIVNLKELNLL